LFRASKYRVPIFPKLFLSFLFIIASLYFLNMAMNMARVGTIRKEIEDSLKSRVHFYHSTLVTDLKRVIQLKNEYLYDKDLMELSFVPEQMSDYQFAEAVLRIRTRLSLLETSSLYIEDVNVHIPLIDRTISSKGYVNSPTTEELDALQGSNYSHPVVSWNNRLLIGGLSPENIVDDSDLLLAFKIQLSKEKLRQSLKQINNAGEGKAVLLDNKGEWAVFSENMPSDDEQRLLEQLRIEIETAPQGTLYRKVNGENHIFVYERSTVLDATTIVYFQEKEILAPLNKHRLWFWWVSLLSIGGVLAFSLWTYRLIHRPIHKLVRAFRKVEQGDLGVALQSRQADEFHYLYTQFNAMVSKLNVLVKEVYEQKIRSQRAVLKQLQSQVNPHFLYNSYFVLYRLAKIPDIDNVVRMARHLGEYFRYITRSRSDEVTLEEEVKHTLAYIQIQMFRFDQRLETHCEDVPETCKHVLVPKLILQPIVENAYEHGLQETTAGGLVQIAFVQQDDDLIISFEDNGAEINDEKIAELSSLLRKKTDDAIETTGMLNVHRRLQLRYGSSYGLAVSRASIGGLRVEMKIGLKQES